MTLEASPLTPLIKFIEFEIPADAKTVKHIVLIIQERRDYFNGV